MQALSNYKINFVSSTSSGLSVGPAVAKHYGPLGQAVGRRDNGGYDMELDRFEQNKKRYLIAMLCLLASLGFIFFSLYILPYLIWQLHYEMPDFIIIWQESFQTNYQLSPAMTILFIFGLFFVPGAIFGFMAYYLSNSIENNLYGIKSDVPVDTPLRRERVVEETGFFLKLILIGVVILVVLAIIHSLISTTPPPQ